MTARNQLTEKQLHNLRGKAICAKENWPLALRYFSDPAHGWLEVSVYQASLLGLCAKDFSEYSYTNGEFQGREFVWFIWSQCPLNDSLKPYHCYYLEEDCDAPIFLQRHREVFGEEPSITDIVLEDDCEIRRLPAIY